MRQNLILRSLTDEDHAVVQAAGEIVPLPIRKTLFEPGQGYSHIYFPLDGIVSIIAVTDAGSVEISTVGHEGMVGLSVFLGGSTALARSMVQVPGQALRVPSTRFRQLTREVPSLDMAVRRYALVSMGHLERSVACNRLHSLEQRCAKWLLMTQDRAGDTFPMTHDFLSQMLGVRRATVTVAAGHLQRKGLIQYRRGKVTVLDREGMEAVACECYARVNEYYREYMPVHLAPGEMRS